MIKALASHRHEQPLTAAPLAYAVELDGVAIGVALPVRGGYEFRTAEMALLALDGRRFRRLSQMRRAAVALRRQPQGATE